MYPIDLLYVKCCWHRCRAPLYRDSEALCMIQGSTGTSVTGSLSSLSMAAG